MSKIQGDRKAVTIYHPQRGWYEEAPPRGALSFGRSPEEPLLPEEGPARARSLSSWVPLLWYDDHMVPTVPFYM